MWGLGFDIHNGELEIVLFKLGKFLEHASDLKIL